MRFMVLLPCLILQRVNALAIILFRVGRPRPTIASARGTTLR
jgi:hypothetical protein